MFLTETFILNKKSTANESQSIFYYTRIFTASTSVVARNYSC